MTHQFGAALQQVDQLAVDGVELVSGGSSGQNENLSE